MAAALFLIRDAGAITDSKEFEISESVIQAVESIDIISLNVLLAEGAKVDTVDDEGNTPLMLASKIGNPRMVKILLAHHPEIDKVNHSGYTALMIAAEQGQIHIVEKLLREGANQYKTNLSGLSASDLAIRNGHPDVAELLRNDNSPVFSR